MLAYLDVPYLQRVRREDGGQDLVPVAHHLPDFHLILAAVGVATDVIVRGQPEDLWPAHRVVHVDLLTE